MPLDRRRLQRRTLGVLIPAQIIGGTGLVAGMTVSALLTRHLGSISVSGLGQSTIVVGTALLAVPTSRLMTVRGRRAGLVAAYLAGAVGAAGIVLAARWHSVPLLFAGLFLFGAGSTANYQARYAGVDLAPPERAARQLSIVVGVATIGSIAGPVVGSYVDDLLGRFGVAKYSGPFVLSVVGFLLAAVLLALALRPDPLLVARELAATPVVAAVPVSAPAVPAAAAGPAAAGLAAAGPAAPPAPLPAVGMRAAAREVRASVEARLGLAAMVVGHMVMVAVMAMTPVHIEAQRPGDDDVLRIVGIVISFHIAGMYAFSPVTGLLTERLGHRRVIRGAVGLLVAGCMVAGFAGHGPVGLAAGLCLLGVGWSGTMVAGSTLLTASVGLANRASAQGLADLIMGLGAAVAGAVAGLVLDWSSYAVLATVAAVLTVPLLALALRPQAVEVAQ